MAYTRNILDPPKGLTPSQEKRWVDTFKWFRTMINGEDFWDEVMGRKRCLLDRAYEYNEDPTEEEL